MSRFPSLDNQSYAQRRKSVHDEQATLANILSVMGVTRHATTVFEQPDTTFDEAVLAVWTISVDADGAHRPLTLFRMTDHWSLVTSDDATDPCNHIGDADGGLPEQLWHMMRRTTGSELAPLSLQRCLLRMTTEEELYRLVQAWLTPLHPLTRVAFTFHAVN